MTQEQKAANDQARGVGALVSIAVMASVVSPQVRNGLVVAGLDASTQVGQQMADGVSANEVLIDKSDVVTAGVIGAFSPTTVSTAQNAIRNVGAIRTLESQATNTVKRAEKVAGRIQTHASELKTAIGAWIAAKLGTAVTQDAINTTQNPEEQK